MERSSPHTPQRVIGPFVALVLAVAVGGVVVAGPVSATTAHRSAPTARTETRSTLAPAGLQETLSEPGAVSTLALPAGTVGHPYFASMPRNGPAAWRLAAGSLPAGLSYNPGDRVVIGLPRQSGVGRLLLESTQGGSRHFEVLQVTVAAAPQLRARQTVLAASTTGTVTGTVTAGGTALRRACVTATSASGAVANTLTGSSGSYSLSGLLPGKWEIFFAGCANNDIGQWWSGQSTQTTARAVMVTAGKARSGVSAQLRPGGELSGIVTVAGSSRGAAGVCVYAESSASLNGLPTVAQGVAESGPTGAYALGGLPTGTYNVEFTPCGSGVNLQSLWWNGEADAMFATGVSVTAGETTAGISPALTVGAEITGTITAEATHQPVAKACVTALSSAMLNGGNIDSYLNYIPVGSAVTNAAGDYAITGIASGNYLVEAAPCGLGELNDYAPTYWHQATPVEATPVVSATAGETTPDISIALRLPSFGNGAVSGTVTSASTHARLADICVLLVNFTAEEIYLAVTGQKGTYLARDVAAGTYETAFEPCHGENYLSALWHKGATFKVKAGVRTQGISIALAPGGVIEGTLETVHGAPLTGMCLLLQQTSGNESSGEEVESYGFGGDYEVAGLPSGKYSIGFGACNGANYTTQFWKRGANLHVKAGVVISHIDFKLGAGGEITGRVTLSNGTAVSDACVTVSNNDATILLPPVFEAAVSFHGGYTVAGLATSADYAVGFGPCSATDNYQSSAWNGNVAVTAGSVTKGISAVLAVGGEISGSVSAVGGAPLSLICVIAVPAFGEEFYEAETLGGSYEIVGLPAGSYEVNFESCDSGAYGSQWWDGVSQQQDATPLIVSAGADTTGISAVLRIG
jgi:hypothetical protein